MNLVFFSNCTINGRMICVRRWYPNHSIRSHFSYN
ncbi:unnamed protein product [Schistosoma curassoni]|uniref:Uncharacterized protein n=1 Tax=Schistosoma curassoni TaxID=6186 RepID=A0A183KF12_9TREM|nr:unnamed protein product [Schistosoma curassoni]